MKTKSSFEIRRNTCSGAKGKAAHTQPQRNGCKEHGFESSSYHVQGFSVQTHFYL